MPNSCGIFTTLSAWNCIRQRKDIAVFLKRIWHKYLPFKMSFLVWRILKDKLPFDDTIMRFVHTFVSKCLCCLDFQKETLHYTFIGGKVASHIWKYFGGPLGISWSDIPIFTMIQRWWALKPKNSVHQTILQVTHVVIFWEIWKARCALKFGGKKGLCKRNYLPNSNSSQMDSC